jgi:hypothetical protein
MTRSFPHLGFDPTPGDPERTSSLSRQPSYVCSESGTTVSELHRLDAGAWNGQAATEFVSHIDHDVVPVIKKAHSSLGRASRALSHWAHQLHSFQAEADALEGEAATRQAALDHARSAVKALPKRQPRTVVTPDDFADSAKKQKALSDADDALKGERPWSHHRFQSQDRTQAVVDAAASR